MLKRKSWNEFRETGLFLFVNQFLHIFGWALVLDPKTKECFPARVEFRGFPESSESAAYLKISKYMKDNAAELFKKVEEN